MSSILDTASRGTEFREDNSATHTPGPWLAATAGSSIVGIPVVGPRGRAIAILHYAAEGVPGRDAYNADQLANARLIAAAPELLAIAKQYASECADCNGSGNSGNEIIGDEECPSCADIRAVIAKTENRT